MKSRIVRKVNADNELRRALLAEQDYELASLNDAMQRGDHAEKERCKKAIGGDSF